MELKPISHFFNKRIYIVPPYQRGYSWGKKQIYDLLNDIRNAIKLDSDHYTGTITIHKQADTEKIGISTYDKYHIVDGQQRFTSLILIINYLLKKLGDNKEVKGEVDLKLATYINNKDIFLFRYSIDEVSENYFRSYVLEFEDMSSKDENIYTRNLKEAKKTISDYFDKDANKGKELKFLSGIEDRLKFNEYIVDSVAEIGVVFETMNNRGIGLSDLELVKNRLLYLASKIQITDEEHRSNSTISNINSKWATILKNLTITNRVLDENSFLSNHWIIYNGWSKDNQTKTDLLNKTFTIEKMIESPTKMIDSINEYVTSLAVTSLHWRYINFPTDKESFKETDDKVHREELKIAFSKLNRLSNSTVRPILLSFMGLLRDKPEELVSLAKIAEIFSFRLFSMNRKRSDTGKNDIFRECYKYLKNYKNQKVIDNAKSLLSWYIDEHGDYKRFSLEIEDLFTSKKKEGYYSWNGLSYFLYEYEESKRNNGQRIVEYDFASKRKQSIEHILPQSYKTHWRETAMAKKPTQMKEFVHSLGNLVLISKGKNSELKNFAFSIKREEYLKGTYSEIEIGKSNRKWTLDKIKQREKHLLNFLEERWQLKESFLATYGNGTFHYITDEQIED